MTTTQRIALEIPDVPREPRCEHCGGGGAFSHNGHDFCCECMVSLTSWLLDGGWRDDPDQFAYVYEESK